MASDKQSRPKARTVRGFRDRAAGELAAERRKLETIRRTFESYGFDALETPFLEYTDALGKFLVASYSVGQLLWLRACAALLLLSPMIWRHRAQFVRLERPWLQQEIGRASCRERV